MVTGLQSRKAVVETPDVPTVTAIARLCDASSRTIWSKCNKKTRSARDPVCFATVLPEQYRQSTSQSVRDRVGLGVKTTFPIVSEANQYRNTRTKTRHGALEVQRLPYGIYSMEVVQTGFARAPETSEIRSSIATEFSVGESIGHHRRCR
jgi:hypothetical protein